MSAYLPYQDPPLPGAPTQEDLIDFETPVADMPGAAPAPLPQKPAKGMSFDFEGLILQLEQNGFDSLSEAQKNLLWDMKEGVQYSPEQMAMYVQNFNQKQLEQSTPKAQAETKAAQLSTQKLEDDRISKAKEQAELAARKSIVLEKIDKYTNPESPNYVNIAPLVGKWDGTVGGVLDASGMYLTDEQRAAQRAELERLVNSDVLELTKFLKPISQDELKFLKSMTPRLHQNDTIWKEYLLDAKSRLQAIPDRTPAVAPQQPTPQAPPAKPQEYKLGSQRLLLNPQTGKYYVAPAAPGR